MDEKPKEPQKDTAPASAEPETLVVTVLYSKNRDLYRLPTLDKACWLSVQTFDLRPSSLNTDQIHLAPTLCVNKRQWRKVYSSQWQAILPGDRIAVPADDPLVLDYEAYGKK